jgi:protein-L-isoaspartate(D-aspartate) O-methyltransferase
MPASAARIVLGVMICAAIAAGWQASRPRAQSAPEETFATLRRAMVDEQLRPRGIRDPRLLEAMGRVPRHRFVPSKHRFLAYSDGALPIAEGQTISQPYVVARMTELLALKGHERVLEIGTGSGYQAAILAEVAAEVYTIEIIPTLAEQARRVLDELGYQRVHTRSGDGYKGWPQAAPFHAIIVTAAPDHVPQPLVDQLADGGRMVLPVGPQDGLQVLRVIEKRDGKTTARDADSVRFVPLVRDLDK